MKVKYVDRKGRGVILGRVVREMLSEKASEVKPEWKEEIGYAETTSYIRNSKDTEAGGCLMC